MRVIRFSNSGFEPHFQKVLFDRQNFIKNTTKSSLRKSFGPGCDWLFDISWNNLLKDRFNLDENFCFTGVHIFFDTATRKDYSFFLNHLDVKTRKSLKRHEMIISGSTIAYNLDSPITQKPSCLQVLYDEGHVGAYMPIFSEKHIDTALC